MVEETNPPENVEKSEAELAPAQNEPVKVFTVESILFKNSKPILYIWCLYNLQ